MTTINKDLLNGQSLNRYAHDLIAQGTVAKDKFRVIARQAGSAQALIDLVESRALELKQSMIAADIKKGVPNASYLFEDGKAIKAALVSICNE